MFYVICLAIFVGSMLTAGGIAEIVKKLLGKDRISKIYAKFGKEYDDEAL